MFEWLFGKKEKRKDDETKKAFSSVKEDINTIGKWLKHLDTKDKQVFEEISELKKELSSIKDDLYGLKEAFELAVGGDQNKQLLNKTPVYDKQTAVEDVYNDDQTTVQTGNFYSFLKNLSSNERLVIMTLLNSDMKLSYEDLALLLGKERSTIRGQINAIKQKSEGLIMESIEKNGKKRVFIPLEIKEKLSKYAKVRVRKKEKKKNIENEEVKGES